MLNDACDRSKYMHHGTVTTKFGVVHVYVCVCVCVYIMHVLWVHL